MIHPYTILLHTQPGQKRVDSLRPDNEDRVLYREFFVASDTPSFLLAVADGVSQCPHGGEVADWLIKQQLKSLPLFTHPKKSRADQLAQVLRSLHTRFTTTFRHDQAMHDSGCTFAAALITGLRCTTFWSGDSPVYLLRCSDQDCQGTQISTPDSNPLTGSLTDCFSGVTPFRFHRASFDLKPGDVVVVATDGLRYEADELASSLKMSRFSAEWLDEICRFSHSATESDDLAIATLRYDPREAAIGTF